MADKTTTSFACGKCGHVNGEKWRMDASVPDWYRYACGKCAHVTPGGKDKPQAASKTQQFYKRYWLQRMRDGQWGVFAKTFNSAAEFYAPSSAQWTRIETHETLEDCKRAVDFLVR